MFGQIKRLSGHASQESTNAVFGTVVQTGVVAVRTTPPRNEFSFPATSVRTRHPETLFYVFSKRFLGVFITLYLINHFVNLIQI
jgi:hypothetical protein